MRGNRAAWAALVVVCLPLMGGCNALLDLIGGLPGGGSGPILVEVFNNSDFEVLPDIRFDPDERVAASTATETLIIGELLPGEFVQFDIDCELLGLIFSDETEVREFGAFIGIAEPSIVARFGNDFLCGDEVVIEFVGQGDFFDIIISVNGFDLN